MSDEEKQSLASRTAAKIRESRWPGWIWGIPIAAIIVVAWLGLRALMSGGTDITITFENANGLKPDESEIVYRGITVGTVSAVELREDGQGVEVSATVEDEAAQFLKSGTRFWLRGAEPSLGNPSTLKAILSGPTIVMDPGPGAKSTRFTGQVGEPIRPAGEAHPQRYRVAFDGAVGALKAGDPVTLRGFTVGQVESTALHVDAASGTVSTPVTLVLFPSLFHRDDPPEAKTPEALQRTVSTLLHQGLHAELERDPPLIGSYSVTLEMMPEQPTETVRTVDGVPEIPVVSGGGLESIMARLDDVPVKRIGRNALAITEQVKDFVSSPELDESLDELHAALAQIRETVAQAGPKITELATELRATADRLEQAVQSADKLMGGPTTQTGLHETIDEVTDAARSIRHLADYLDRHPEALLKGR